MAISNDDLQFYINQAKAAGFSDFIIQRFITNNGPDDIRRWESALSPENDPYFGQNVSTAAPLNVPVYATPVPISSPAALAASASPSDALISGSASGFGGSVSVSTPAVTVGATTVQSPSIPWLWIGVAALAAYLLFGRKERR